MPHWYAVVSNYTVTQYAPSSSQPWLHVNPEVVVAMCCLPPPCNTEIPCCGLSWTPSIPVVTHHGEGRYGVAMLPQM